MRCGIAVVAMLASVGSVAAQAEGESQETLLPLCTPGLAKSNGADDALALYDLGNGALGADLADPKHAAHCSKATSGQLSLRLGDLAFNLSSGLEYDAVNQRRFKAATLNQALCESYQGGTDGYAVEFRNSNGDVQGLGGLLRGVTSLRYNLANREIVPELLQTTHGPWLRCYDATLPNVVLQAGSADTIFGASFENSGDLRVEFLSNAGAPLANDQMVSTIGSDSVYKVRVSNHGEAAATSVRIREFVPKSGTQSPAPSLNTVSCVDEADQSSCGALALSRDIATLAPGEARTYTLTRRVPGTTAIPAASGALAAVAAFVDPNAVAEENQADNVRHLRIGLIANGLPVAVAQNLNTSEDTALPVTLSGTDPDGDAITAFSVTDAPDHGSLSGTAPNLSYTPAADYNGPDSFRFTVTDARGGVSDAATVAIAVAAVNDGPRVGTQLLNASFAEGATVEIDASAAFSDPESNAFTVNVTGLPSGISYFSNLRAIAGTLNLTTAGVYTVTLTATETATGLTATQQFTLTVTNTNQNPTVASPIADQTSNEGAVVSLNVASSFADADANDTLSFSVTAGALPAGLTLAPNGQISGTISQTAATGSPYSVTVSANDGQGGTVSDTFAWTVSAVNVAPVAASLSNRLGVENEVMEILGSELRAAFSDPDDPTAPFHDTLTFSASVLPTGLNYIPSSSNISGVPAFGTDGDHVITVTATDPGGLTASQTFTLTIANTNRAPTVANPIPDQSATVAAAFSLQFAADTFSDLDTSDTLTYGAQLTGGGALPAWLSFDAVTRTFSGTPGAGDTGAPSIDVTANDGQGGNATDTFVITVN